MIKVRDGCEKIQQFGKRLGDDGSEHLDEDYCLDQIRDAVKLVKLDYADVEQALREYYAQFE